MGLSLTHINDFEFRAGGSTMCGALSFHKNDTLGNCFSHSFPATSAPLLLRACNCLAFVGKIEARHRKN